MSRYRKIDPRIWNDEKFLSLTRDEKLAWVYTLTSEQTNAIGLYRLSLEKMATDLAVETASVRRSIGIFETKSMIKWDPRTALIWIPKWTEYNAPSGTNQCTGYLSVAGEFLPHPFAIAFTVLMTAVQQMLPGQAGLLSKRQAIIVRDHVQCVYCKKILTNIMDIELDHTEPCARTEGGRHTYRDRVTSCQPCNQQKGTRTAEEFGYPFVAGRDYSIGEAVMVLVRNPEVRKRFATLFHGLPKEIENVTLVSDLLAVETSLLTSSRRRHNGVVTQEQEQEQEEEEEALIRAEQVGNVPTDAFTSEKLVSLYNAVKPEECPAIGVITTERRKKYGAYLKQFPTVAYWDEVFAQMHQSRFLRGLESFGDRTPIARGLDWLCQKGKDDGIENCQKTYEKKYIDKSQGHAAPNGEWYPEDPTNPLSRDPEEL